MTTTMTDPTTGAPAGGRRKGAQQPGGGFSLKTREGKMVAGMGAVLVVVVFALRKNAGGGGEEAAGPPSSYLQGGYDGTLQDRLDAVGFRGGTLEEWITATTGLSGSVDSLADLLEKLDPTKTPTTPTPTGFGGIKAKDAPGGPNKPSWITYVTKPGDTLSSIASTFYGNPGGWQYVWDMNRGVFGGPKDANRPLGVGAQLVIRNPQRGY